MSEKNPVEVPSFEKTKTETPFGILVFKSFSVVALLGLIFFAIYWSFGRVAFQNHSREELYAQVLRGQADVRRLAALGWSAKLQLADSQSESNAFREYLPTDEEAAVLAQELKSLEASSRPDIDLMAGVLGVLGHSYSLVAQEALRNFLLVKRGAEWSAAQIQAVAGLSRRSPESPETLEVLNSLVQSSADPALRKTIAYGLGFSEEGEAGEEAWSQKSAMLEALLQDTAVDVRWNAAFSALRLGMALPAAQKQVADLIAELADDLAQGAYTKAREGDVVQKRETYFAALSFASPETWNQIREIADGHPDLKIRQAAKVTLGNKMPDREKRR